ncbi:MDR family MFS transporter [Bifidobacterium lemurum]|uniref:MDR family MFS transporter n=1 Tax=Bifidobacterium lemurum TaxID=1603886 RepID=UPI001967224A|nr:MDR family MFS transporter [Bifidobacterium lemurum]
MTRRQTAMIAVMIFGCFITTLNQTVVSPAQPSIMHDMGVDTTTVQWLTTGFTLVNAIMIPITAWLTDKFSTRAIFITGLLVFTAGTLVAGVAPNFALLLVGRLVQAASVGVMMPLVMTVMMLIFPADQRGSAMGVFSIVIAFAPAVGPSLAGVVIDHYNWRVLFFGIAALAVVAAVAAFFALDDIGERRDPGRLDWTSVAMSTLGFGGLLYGCSTLGSSFNIVDVVIALVGAAFIVLFFLRQLRLDHPMLEVRVLFNRQFLIGTAIVMIVQASMLAAGVLMPIYLQSLRGFSATTSGLVLLPGALLMGLLGPITGRLFDKYGPRALSLTGLGVLTVATLGFSFLSDDTSLTTIVILYTVRMAAIGLVNMPINTWAMNALDNSVMNHGTSVNNTLRQVAGSLGTALLVSVSSIVASANTGRGVEPVRANIVGLNWAFAIGTALCAAALALAVAFVRNRAADARQSDPDDARRMVLESIMVRDVFTLPTEATVLDAMRLMVGKGISAAPIVDDQGRPVGFVSDGDVMRYLARRDGTIVDPVSLTMFTGLDRSDFGERVGRLADMKVTAIGAKGVIGVDVHAGLPEVCRVLGDNHLKKVPVLQDGRIVGVINRSNITRYSMESFLDTSAQTA